MTALFALQFVSLSPAQNDQDPQLLNAVLQQQQALLAHAPQERSSGAAVAAPVRAILTPVLYFSNKPLPDSGKNGLAFVKFDHAPVQYYSAHHGIAWIAADVLPLTALADARAPPALYS